MAHKGQNFSRSMLLTWPQSHILHVHKSSPALSRDRMTSMTKGRVHGSSQFLLIPPYSYLSHFSDSAPSFLLAHWLISVALTWKELTYLLVQATE